MKKRISFILVGIFAIGFFAGCGTKTIPATNNNSTEQTTTNNSKTSNPATNTTGGGVLFEPASPLGGISAGDQFFGNENITPPLNPVVDASTNVFGDAKGIPMTDTNPSNAFPTTTPPIPEPTIFPAPPIPDPSPTPPAPAPVPTPTPPAPAPVPTPTPPTPKPVSALGGGIDPFAIKDDGIIVTEIIPFVKTDDGNLTGEAKNEFDNVKKKS
ncbi:MAG: hypothetical protein LBT09_03810 [Planctomycetaceae bacterium]|jgi:hypothetical protein|nr:hypothetical protein [Planctomycetaceae bacterium]